MKQLIVLFLCISSIVTAQEYGTVDVKVRKYPKYTSAQRLATKIKSDFNNDGDKIRAVFIWLTANIRYDLQEYNNPSNRKIGFKYRTEAERQIKLQQIKDQIVNETFKNRKSVCEGYAQSFKKVCDLLDIEAVVVTGYARNSSQEIGVIPRNSNHAWNAVKMGLKWQLVDATWAAGHEENNKWKQFFSNYYFYPNPTDLIRSHLPEQNAWQLLQNPVSKKAYANQPMIGQGFLNKNLRLMSPKTGIITKKGTIVFNIKNLKPSHSISYVFKNQQYGKRATVQFSNKTGRFPIDVQNKRNTELYIFINNEVALEYKIK